MSLVDLVFKVFNTWLMFAMSTLLAVLALYKAHKSGNRGLSRAVLAMGWFLFGLTFLIISVADFPEMLDRAWLRFMFAALVLINIIYHWQYLLLLIYRIRELLRDQWKH